MNLIHNPPQCLLAGSTAHQGFTRPFSSAIADRELTFLSSSEFSSTLCVHACVCVCVRKREGEREKFQVRDSAMPWLEYKPKQ